jgi:tRNA(adenine34) deaminase
MRLALDEARAAYALDEVPIGAVVVRGDAVLGRGHNRVLADCDPTAHAECLALREAARAVAAVRLVGCEVYTTVEPCFMCAGALLHARVERLVFSVRDPKFGACVSLGRVLDHPGANHRLIFAEGLLAAEARALLQHFFRAKRVPGGTE